MIPDPTAFYPADYGEARRRFREAADRLGWERRAYPIGRAGPDGDEWTIDAAVSPGDADRALVVSSGLHGVEGPFGSAVQLAAFDRIGPVEGVRLVFLHALNPFGFAQVRRFDEDNIDPNRNFLLDGQAYEGSPPGYAALDGLLNPPSPPRLDAFPLRAWARVVRHGLAALKLAVVVGQYEFPRGLFFGGRGPSRRVATLAEGLPGWVGRASRIVHLDFHTGLGRWGTYKLLIDHPLSPEMDAWLGRRFGAENLERWDASKVAYPARGGLAPWCRQQLAGRSYIGLCAEFGTYGPIRILDGLRAENRAHHWGDPRARSTIRAKARLRELFVPASPAWRARCLEQGLDLIKRAAAGLGGEGPPF